MSKKVHPADNFLVSPYNPNELYAVSTAGSVVKYSRAGGANWKVFVGRVWRDKQPEGLFLG
jgi:hypothetical protein